MWRKLCHSGLRFVCKNFDEYGKFSAYNWVDTKLRAGWKLVQRWCAIGKQTAVNLLRLTL